MGDPKTYHITTPIYYVNDVPHVGHAYTTIAADTLARALRLQGHDVFLLTGTDEHGQNIERIAREKGISEQQHCNEIVEVWKRLWKRLDISHDRFVRTTDENHVRGVLKLWNRLIEARTPDGREALYRGTYAGWYCPRCEEFKEEEDLKQPGNLCPVHERPSEWTEEENFFFRLSAYESWLRKLIETDEMEIRPQTRKNEVLGIVQQGLKDFSASRARVKWGIPVPQQPDHVMYVWVDALANYVTALGYGDDAPDYRKYWGQRDDDAERKKRRVRHHLVGKDIIRFHCLYWPALLYAAGQPVPTHVFAQGWMTKDGRKLSKTTGNVIVPDELIDRLGRDAVRYFLLREAPYGHDWDYTDQSFVGRYNSDLADDLGNLVSRALTMVHRYCGGRVPPRPTVRTAGGVDSIGHEEALEHLPTEMIEQAMQRYAALDFAGALTGLWTWVSWLNRRIVEFSPWERAKDPAQRENLDAFLYRMLEAIRLLGVLVSPVTPDASRRIFGMLGLERAPGPQDLERDRLEPGSTLGSVEPLFPRVEKTDPSALNSKETIVSEESKTPPAPLSLPAPAGDKIDITDFAKVELRVAQITAAEKVAGSKRLIKLQVDVGTETRQVVAGIAETYEPEALVGKKVALVANLKPAKLMGVESNGMVLAASVDGKAVLCTFDTDVQPGTKIK